MIKHNFVTENNQNINWSKMFCKS